jgi:hypothetical protein
MVFETSHVIPCPHCAFAEGAARVAALHSVSEIVLHATVVESGLTRTELLAQLEQFVVRSLLAHRR